MPAPKRNKEAAASLKSSANGGQFAKAVKASSSSTLSRQVELPAGAEHIPDPLPGQLMIDGSPAPATFAEAWAHIFAPLEAFKNQHGHYPRPAHMEAREYCFKKMGLGQYDFGDMSISIVDEKLGSILKVRSTMNDPGCEHEGVAGKSCQALGCGCPHCILAHAGKLPGVVDVEKDFDSADYWSDDDDEYYVSVEFKIPEDVRAEARKLSEEVSPLQPLITIHNVAKNQPWRILQKAVDAKPEDDRGLAKLKTQYERATKAAEPYRGINPNGSADYTYVENNPGSLAAELQEIYYALGTFAPPPRARGKNSSEEAKKTAEHYRKCHEKHQQMIADIESVEQALGKPLPDSIRRAALEENRFASNRYDYGILRGRKRANEIVDKFKKSSQKVANLKAKVHDMQRELEQHIQWGQGWPGHPLDAPTPQQWAELSGAEVQEAWS